jgi:hypothetical protein
MLITFRFDGYADVNNSREYSDKRNKTPPPFFPKNVIIALISSILEEKQANVWELDCNEIVPKAFTTELFLEKVHKCLRVKYFSQIYISQAEYMNTKYRLLGNTKNC